MSDERTSDDTFTDTRSDDTTVPTLPTQQEFPTTDTAPTTAVNDAGEPALATTESPADNPTAEVSDPAVPETPVTEEVPVTDDTPIWTDTVDASATTDQPEVPVTPASQVPFEPSPGDSVPDSPVDVPVVPDTAVVAEEPHIDTLYDLEESGVPNPSQPLFEGDEVPFILEFLSNKFPDEIPLAKIRFMLRANYNRDKNPDYRTEPGIRTR